MRGIEASRIVSHRVKYNWSEFWYLLQARDELFEHELSFFDVVVFIIHWVQALELRHLEVIWPRGVTYPNPVTDRLQRLVELLYRM